MRKIILLVVVVCLVPSVACSLTGQELYVKLMNFPDLYLSPQETEDGLLYFSGALKGIETVLDDLDMMMNVLNNQYENIDSAILVQKFLTINMPKKRDLSEFVMIFNKWARDNPKLLDMSSAYCIYLSLKNAYGPARE